jgi:hypothetical protein
MNEDNYDDKFSNGPKDFRVRPQIYNLTNEYDVQSLFLQPHIKTSETVGKGVDEDGNVRMGYKPTGFSEFNTTDLQTGVLETDTERAYVNIASLVEMVLYDLKTQYNVDTSRSFEFIRGRVGTFMSTTKSKNGKLLDAITTKRFLQKSVSQTDLNSRAMDASQGSQQQGNLI